MPSKLNTIILDRITERYTNLLDFIQGPKVKFSADEADIGSSNSLAATPDENKPAKAETTSDAENKEGKESDDTGKTLLSSALQTFKVDVVALFNYAVLKGEYHHKNSIALITAIEKMEREIFKYLYSRAFSNRVSTTLLFEYRKILKTNLEKDIEQLEKSGSDNEVLAQKRITLTEVDAASITLVEEQLAGFIKNAKVDEEDLDSYTEHFHYLAMDAETRKKREHKHLLDTRLNSELEHHVLNIRYYLRDNLISDVNTYLYALNVKLAELDEGYLADMDTLNYLIKHEVNLDDLFQKGLIEPDNPYASVIRNKCNYLTLKILRRLQKSGISSFAITYLKELRTDTTVNQREYSIDSLKLPESLEHYSSFDEKSLYHYQESKELFELSQDKVKHQVAKVVNNLGALSNLEIRDIHFYCKVIKSNAEAIAESEILFEQYAKTLEALREYYANAKFIAEAADDKFNLFAYESALYLVCNAAFLLEANKKISECADTSQFDTLFDHLRKDFKLRKDEYHSKALPNLQLYFYYFKMAVLASEKVETIISDNVSLLDVKEVNKKIGRFYKKVYDSYSEFVGFSDRCSYDLRMPIYLSIEECFTSTCIKYVSQGETLDIDLFLDGAYILPSNYKHFKLMVEEIIFSIRNVEASIYSRLINSNLESQFAAQKAEHDETSKVFIKTVEEKAKDGQYNAIQMIAIYAAVITFILGSAVVITKLPSNEVVFMFMIIYAASLCLFSLMIRIIFVPAKLFKPKTKNKEETELNGVVASVYLGISIFYISILYVAITKISDYSKVNKFSIIIDKLELKNDMDSLNYVIESDTGRTGQQLNQARTNQVLFWQQEYERLDMEWEEKYKDAK